MSQIIRKPFEFGPEMPNARSTPSAVSQEARVPGHISAASENDGDVGNGLILRVQAKRADVERYLRAIGARRGRMLTVTIVAAAISTLLTGPAALGGQALLTETLGLPVSAWRILCAVAAVCSLTAAVVTQLQTSKNYEEHIPRAQEVKVKLPPKRGGIDYKESHAREAEEVRR
jgi:hypothetical protein